MHQYLTLLEDVLNNGIAKDDRTGTGTLSVFGRQVRFDLSAGFPLLTTKKLHWHSIVHELLWFLSGDTNIAYLNENNVKIWDEWADDNGDLGPVYGAQWIRSRHGRNKYSKHERKIKIHRPLLPYPWAEQYKHELESLTVSPHTVDQISNVIEDIKFNPDSRRHIVCAWNIGQLDKMKLPPCHVLFQFYVANNCLSCQLYQRSADIFLGVPFNIASYALLTMMTAQVCGLQVGEFVHTFGDLHLYNNHIEQAKTQLSRAPLSLPQVSLSPSVNDIFAFTADDIKLQNYETHPHIAAPVAV